ncbi:hypothetical protein Taro_032383 [Colocasia esculenta]|uniref:Uncharacterized protein n=1 Tax=Colocasia esculenta TaxID=4460 RepID=A0A843VL76_COLES|nr:hypothetical protein [Colocasia esculenta]
MPSAHLPGRAVEDPPSICNSLLPSFPATLAGFNVVLHCGSTMPPTLNFLSSLLLVLLSFACMSHSAISAPAAGASFSRRLQRETPLPQSMNMSMDPSERETLFRVMEAVSSDRDWRVANPDPCTPGSSWPGIECTLGRQDGLLHVTRLDFGTPLNPTCRKAAIFPSDVFALPYLQSLFFFNCFRSRKTSLSAAGSAMEGATALQQLSLKSNPALAGSIPPEISSLRSLQILTLSQNNLQGDIPGAVAGLTSLVHLDLSYNAFTGTIPSQMGDLKNLVGLDLSYNSLTGSIPASIGQMGALQKLDLSSNSLTGGIPESFENLGSLSFLALSSNRLRGPFPGGLPRLGNLQYLIMEDNPMAVELPSQLGQLTRLQELRLGNSGYWGPIPESFGRLCNLTTLSLQNNHLSGAIPAGLSGLGRIYHLNLSRNMLGGVVPFDSSFLRRLGRNLDLSGNPGLCLNRSEAVVDSVKAGVGVCGANGTSSVMEKQFGRSQGAASVGPPSPAVLLFGLLGIWGLRLPLF